MARIRSVKPSFWTDEKLAPMAALERLVFLGLCTFADARGQLYDSHRMIDGHIFQMTPDSSADSLVRLAAAGLIVRFVTPNGRGLIQINDWGRHVGTGTIREAIPAAIRREVLERDGGRCRYCGATAPLALDHIYPYSRGGRHAPANLQVLCRPCNSRKAARVLS